MLSLCSLRSVLLSLFWLGAPTSSVTFNRNGVFLLILLGPACSCLVLLSFSRDTSHVARIDVYPVHSRNRHVFCVAPRSMHSNHCLFLFLSLCLLLFLLHCFLWWICYHPYYPFDLLSGFRVLIYDPPQGLR